jgi:hypothetical protein
VHGDDITEPVVNVRKGIDPPAALDERADAIVAHGDDGLIPELLFQLPVRQRTLEIAE